MRRIGICIVLATAVWAADTKRASDRSDGFAANVAYRLGPGDVIDINVFEVEELSKPAVIAPDGTVTLPLIGAVEMGGLTTQQAAERLRRLYGDDYIRDPQISVVVKEYHSQPVSVLGAVTKPGVYQLRGPRRLSDILALAEGLAPDSGAEVTISRPLVDGSEQRLTVATRDLLSLNGREEANPFVEGGDTIRVSKAGIIYVVGEVGRPGGFPLKDQEQITALKALSLAEGLRRTAAAQRSKIIRNVGAERQETAIRLKDVLEGREPDVSLAPGDILFVPNSQARSALGRGAEAAIQVATGVIIWRR
jgi:polysaccharide export outer membrane protein